MKAAKKQRQATTSRVLAVIFPIRGLQFSWEAACGARKVNKAALDFEYNSELARGEGMGGEQDISRH